MKVQITRSYTDTQFNRQMSIGEVIEVTPERAGILINRDFAISLETTEVREYIVSPIKKTRAKRK